jgi:plastocyanin
METGSDQVGVRVRVPLFAAAAVLAAAMACGGDSTTSPSGPGGGGTTGLTITIQNNTVTPSSLTVPQGSQVTFVNNDVRAHEMFSDPHPEHTDCPEINQVGYLDSGQSRQTGNLVTIRTCGYHDHNLFTVKSLQGTITIR